MVRGVGRARLARPRRAVILLAALALAGVAVALAWSLLVHDTSEPASVQAAVARFRADDRPAVGVLSAPTPEPGVYVYATSGSESVDALLGSTHTYPQQTTITVEKDGCGLHLRWDALAGRSTTWELCPSREGWAVLSYAEVHRFFGQTERTTYVCDTGSLWTPASEAPGTTFDRRCSTGDTTEDSAGRVVGAETLNVGDEQLETMHLALSLTLSGRSRGTGTLDLWLATDNGLVVRLSLTNDNVSDVRDRRRPLQGGRAARARLHRACYLEPAAPFTPASAGLRLPSRPSTRLARRP